MEAQQRQDEEDSELKQSSTSPNLTHQASPKDKRPSSTDHCLVCYSDLSHTTITECGHNDICAVCHLRLRHLHDEKKCPMCKATNDKVIVDIPSGKEYDDYQDSMWGNELGSNFVYRDDVGMFFPISYYKSDILPLFGHHCTVKNCSFKDDLKTDDEDDNNDRSNKKGKNKNNNSNNKSPIKRLKDHLRTKHRLTLCDLCVENKRDFVSKLPRFTPNQLNVHMTKGDGEGSGFKGHPLCEFCRPKRFYDLSQLHSHLQKEHYKCHVCEKQNKPNQYFKNYQQLERHFERRHYLCKDAQCLAARFVVFENEIDLRGHELSVHGGTSTGSTKINLEFRVRRAGVDGSGYENQDVPSEEDFSFGLDGQAFVPDDIPQNELDEATAHPAHLARTAMFRAQAEQIRQEQTAELQAAEHERAFPSIGGTTSAGVAANAAPLRVGWTERSTGLTTGNSGTSREEAFPALPAASSNKKKFATGIGRKARGPPIGGAGSTASAISSASNWSSSVSTAHATTPTLPQSYGQTSTASVTPTLNRGADLSSNNFPSLPGATSSRATKNYAAVEALAAKKQQNRAAELSANSFPSLGVTSRQFTGTSQTRQQAKMTPNDFPALGGGTNSSKSHRYEAAEQYAKKHREQVTQDPFPSLSNYPVPYNSKKKNNVKDKVLGEQKPMSQDALSNVLQFPPPSASAASSKGNAQQKNISLEKGKATTEQMKAVLGPPNYKKLKNFTKDFASENLGPEAYVDHTAALFDNGFGDANFWAFVPGLVESCPNESSAQKAIQYMERLRISGHSKLGFANGSHQAPVQSAVHQPTRTAALFAQSKPKTTAYIVPTGKKTTWGSSSNSRITQSVAAKPGSVSAAKKDVPQARTATKYMAKEKKKQIKQNAPKTKSQKKKQKDELRSLAFGK